MKCLIIAAGKGERIRALHDCKPLLPLSGRPLIEHVMESAVRGGATAFVVVTGYEGDRVRAVLDAMPYDITHVVNAEWNRANGISVLRAREALREPFLLTMSDHLFNPSIVRDLLRQPLAGDEVMLAVDYRLDNPLVDLDDVTRALVRDGRIEQLGKGLATYNAFDTGLFYASPALFDALEAASDESLSGGMRELARLGRARAFDIGERFWLDVDDPRAADLAERHVGG